MVLLPSSRKCKSFAPVINASRGMSNSDLCHSSRKYDSARSDVGDVGFDGRSRHRRRPSRVGMPQRSVGETPIPSLPEERSIGYAIAEAASIQRRDDDDDDDESHSASALPPPRRIPRKSGSHSARYWPGERSLALWAKLGKSEK